MSYVYDMHPRRRPNRMLSLRAEIYGVSLSLARTQSKRIPVHQISYDSYDSIVKSDTDVGTDSSICIKPSANTNYY